MIHYHGGPITPLSVAHAVWCTRHAFVSFERPEQIALAAEVCQSFALDNGAFSAWRRGANPDWAAYAAWCRRWGAHPGCDFAVIPDVIDGDEAANDALLTWWLSLGLAVQGVPVWHLHESLDRLARLVETYPRIALGSSGAYADVATESWWHRMGAAMAVVCDDEGYPRVKLHGLRMLNVEVTRRLPLASADSTNVAQNHAREKHRYALSSTMGALSIVDRIEHSRPAARWAGAAYPLPGELFA